MTKKRMPTDQPAQLSTHLVDLLAAKGLTASPVEGKAPPTPSHTAHADLSKAGKLVLRRERKGRGGKTVTILTGLALPAPRLEELARAMKKALGCGAAVENGAIVLLGDIPDRAEAWLRKQGARQIVIGN